MYGGDSKASTVREDRIATRNQRGLSTVELVVLLVLIAAVAIGTWRAFGASVASKLTATNEQLTEALSSTYDEQESSRAENDSPSTRFDGDRSVSANDRKASRSATLATSIEDSQSSRMAPTGASAALIGASPPSSGTSAIRNNDQLNASVGNASEHNSASPQNTRGSPSTESTSAESPGATASDGVSEPSLWESPTEYVRNSAPAQTALGIAAGTLQALAPGGFLLPSPWGSSRAFEAGRGIGQLATGIVQVVTGVGMVGGGGAAAVAGAGAAPVSGGGSLVVSAGGVAVASEGAIVGAQGATNVAAGVRTLSNAVMMSGKDPTNGGPVAPPKINMGQQGKHLPDHNNYTAGRSILKSDPQELAKRAGTGIPANNVARGQPGFRERVRYDEVIGDYVKDGIATPTKNAIIHYGKDGIHIVPAAP